MFKTLGMLSFNNKMNKAAKVACKELGLDYLGMVAPLSSKWQMDIMGPTIQNLQYYQKEERWNEYQLAIAMFLNGFGDDQVEAASEEHFKRISERIRWWGNIGVISQDYVNDVLGYFESRRADSIPI